ncbi:hypothetical protein [Brucella pseudogrignonensis]|uniref:Uncharacterized protein n=1 Tax=Brucella pseudogrignonensis TaxID=419475 RepID=A0ABU1M8L3_9HYPH|nr:hypothetical protein [Brucella pseudogrignonensis]MDR6432051.1 hypothetical protein [Brucella pseudogrignonensis]
MIRSRGEPPKTLINKEYPFQVVLFMTDWHRTNLIPMLNDRTRLGGYRLWNTTLHDIKYFEIAMFKTEQGQQEFIRLYGGVSHDPWDNKSKPWETYFEKCDRNPVT